MALSNGSFAKKSRVWANNDVRSYKIWHLCLQANEI